MTRAEHADTLLAAIHDVAPRHFRMSLGTIDRNPPPRTQAINPPLTHGLINAAAATLDTDIANYNQDHARRGAGYTIASELTPFTAHEPTDLYLKLRTAIVDTQTGAAARRTF